MSAKRAHCMQNWRNCMHPKNQIRIGIWSGPRDGIRKWKSLCLKFATSKSKSSNLGTLCLRLHINNVLQISQKHFNTKTYLIRYLFDQNPFFIRCVTGWQTDIAEDKTESLSVTWTPYYVGMCIPTMVESGNLWINDNWIVVEQNKLSIH